MVHTNMVSNPGKDTYCELRMCRDMTSLRLLVPLLHMETYVRYFERAEEKHQYIKQNNVGILYSIITCTIRASICT